MSDIFELKPGDNKRALRGKASDYEAGSAKFVGAAVKLRMMDARGVVVIDQAAVILDDDGIFGYAWKPGETDVRGKYRAEFVVTYADGLEDTYPSFGFIPVHIGQEVP